MSPVSKRSSGALWCKKHVAEESCANYHDDLSDNLEPVTSMDGDDDDDNDDGGYDYAPAA